MTLSGRHGIALAALVAVALIPIAWTVRSPRRADPCRIPGALLDVGAIPGSEARGQQLDKLGSDVIQWSEGVVPRFPFPDLEFQVVRSFDARRLYENPVRLLESEIEPEEHDLLSVEVGGTVLPVHLVRDGAKVPARMAAYLFVYGREPVRYPFLHALRSSASQFLGGTVPLTAILVEAPVPERVHGQTEAAAVTWIEDAWRHFAGACGAAGA